MVEAITQTVEKVVEYRAVSSGEHIKCDGESVYYEDSITVHADDFKHACLHVTGYADKCDVGTVTVETNNGEQKGGYDIKVHFNDTGRVRYTTVETMVELVEAAEELRDDD